MNNNNNNNAPLKRGGMRVSLVSFYPNVPTGNSDQTENEDHSYAMHAARKAFLHSTTLGKSLRGHTTSLTPLQLQRHATSAGPTTVTKKATVIRPTQGEKEPEPHRILIMLDRMGLYRPVPVLLSLRRTTFLDVVAGIVVGVLVFVFCSVFAQIVFGENGLGDFVSVGSETYLLSAVIAGLAHTFYSAVGCAMASPDIFPTLFLANMAEIIIAGIGKADASSSSSPNATFSMSNSTEIQQIQMVKTIFVATALSTGILGVLLLIMGYFRLTRFIERLPAPFLSGFIACVGASVLIKAIKTAMPMPVYAAGASFVQFWALALPGAPIGIGLYIHKRHHLGRPAVMWPLLTGGPLILFYICVYATGGTVSTVRSYGWTFEVYDQTRPAEPFEILYQTSDIPVAWDVLGGCVVEMFLLWLVVVLDVVLKQAGSRRILEAFELQFPHETILSGGINVLFSFLVAPPSYQQLKLTVLAAGVTHNTRSRVPGAISTLIQIILYASGFPVISYLPRFWLAGLLYFACAGLLWENLVDSFWKVTIVEFLEIWLMLLISQFFAIIYALVAGFLVSLCIYLYHYGRIGGLKGSHTLSQNPSRTVRFQRAEHMLQQSLGHRAIVIQFARVVYSHQTVSLMRHIDAQLAQGRFEPGRGHPRFVILDFSSTYVMDATALDKLMELLKRVAHDPKAVDEDQDAPEFAFEDAKHRRARMIKNLTVTELVYRERVIMVASGLSGKVLAEFEKRGIIDALCKGGGSREERVFPRRDDAKRWVEDRLLQESAMRAGDFLVIPAFQSVAHRTLHLRREFGVVGLMLSDDLLHGPTPLLWRYFDRCFFQAGHKLNTEPALLLLSSGSCVVQSDDIQLLRTGPGCFVNVACALTHVALFDASYTPLTVIAETAVQALSLSTECLEMLETELPHAAMLLRQSLVKFHVRLRTRVNRILIKEQSVVNNNSTSMALLEREKFDENEELALLNMTAMAQKFKGDAGDTFEEIFVLPQVWESFSLYSSPEIHANLIRFRLPGYVKRKIQTLYTTEWTDKTSMDGLRSLLLHFARGGDNGDDDASVNEILQNGGLEGSTLEHVFELVGGMLQKRLLPWEFVWSMAKRFIGGTNQVENFAALTRKHVEDKVIDLGQVMTVWGEIFSKKAPLELIPIVAEWCEEGSNREDDFTLDWDSFMSMMATLLRKGEENKEFVTAFEMFKKNRPLDTDDRNFATSADLSRVLGVSRRRANQLLFDLVGSHEEGDGSLTINAVYRAVKIERWGMDVTSDLSQEEEDGNGGATGTGTALIAI